MISCEINEIAQKQIKAHGTSNPYRICDDLGIIVKPRRFKTLKGVYMILIKNPCIFISDKLDENMERLILTHELGHHFLHGYLAKECFQEFAFFDMSAKPEREANVFAADFLLNDDDIEESIESGYTSEQLARLFNVPHELLLIKLQNMNSRGYDFNVCFDPRSDFLHY